MKDFSVKQNIFALNVRYFIKFYFINWWSPKKEQGRESWDTILECLIFVTEYIKNAQLLASY